jgi:hypothetical protein
MRTAALILALMLLAAIVPLGCESKKSNSPIAPTPPTPDLEDGETPEPGSKKMK